jgi:APA family basic amino acid/polyamine antiporter
MLPCAGGVFIFLHEAYGPEVAFLKGWQMLIIGPSAWAALGLIFAEYTRTFIPLGQRGVRFLATASRSAITGGGGLLALAPLRAADWSDVVT